MQLRHSITYDAPADSVWEMLSDPAFRERSCDAMGVLDRDITIEPAGEGMRVRIDQVQPTAGVPSFARKFAGETTRAIQAEEWSDRRHATLEVDTPGKPSRIRGTLTLTESAGRTTETFDGEVKVTVPLIGGRLESLVADLFTAGMDNEHTAGVAWLKETAEMHFHQELQYDAAPAEVYAMLSDPAFREAVCEAGDSIRHDVSISPNGDGMTVAVDQVQPAAGIPSFAKKIVGDEIEILQREEWHSPTDAGLEVTIPHKPGHLNGTVTLRESGGGTVETVDAEIKVHVPLVGGKLEKLIADLLSAALRSEERVGKSWLAGDR